MAKRDLERSNAEEAQAKSDITVFQAFEKAKTLLKRSSNNEEIYIESMYKK